MEYNENTLQHQTQARALPHWCFQKMLRQLLLHRNLSTCLCSIQKLQKQASVSFFKIAWGKILWNLSQLMVKWQYIQELMQLLCFPDILTTFLLQSIELISFYLLIISNNLTNSLTIRIKLEFSPFTNPPFCSGTVPDGIVDIIVPNNVKSLIVLQLSRYVRYVALDNIIL